MRSAYDNSLQLAAEYRLARLAFPNISTGVYGFPKSAAARIAIDAVRAFLAHNDWPQQVIFVCFDAENARLYQTALEYIGGGKPNGADVNRRQATQWRGDKSATNRARVLASIDAPSMPGYSDDRRRLVIGNHRQGNVIRSFRVPMV